jgi:hypothetical protein
MYKNVKNALQKSGELMIKAADGQTFELHLHNVTFDDANELVVLDAGTETYWIKGQDIIYMWVHRVKE